MSSHDDDAPVHPLIDAAISRQTAELKEALWASDDQAFPFLKFHLLAERMLEQLISIRLPRGKRLLTEGRLSFHQKALLVDGLDIVPSSAINALLEVNRVRNRLAHQKDARITAGDLEGIAAQIEWPEQVGRPPVSEAVLGVSMTLILPEVYRHFAVAAAEAELRSKL